MLTRLILLLIMFIAMPKLAHSASFECEAALHIAEKVICGSQELSRLDEQLSREYKSEVSKDYVEKQQLRKAQNAWLLQRNACEYSFDCIKTKLQQRIASFRSDNTLAAYSWGGKLRAKPTLDSKQIGSTGEKQTLIILHKAAEKMDGYNWFYIETKKIKAYQWGGILCSPEYPQASYCPDL